MSMDLDARSIMSRIMHGITCDEDGNVHDWYAMKPIDELVFEIHRLRAENAKMRESLNQYKVTPAENT